MKVLIIVAAIIAIIYTWLPSYKQEAILELYKSMQKTFLESYVIGIKKGREQINSNLYFILYLLCLFCGFLLYFIFSFIHGIFILMARLDEYYEQK